MHINIFSVNDLSSYRYTGKFMVVFIYGKRRWYLPTDGMRWSYILEDHVRLGVI